MEENNNQSTQKVEKKSSVIEKLKQVQKKTLYAWIVTLAVLLGTAAMMYSYQMGQTLKAKEKIETLEEEITQLNDKYDILVSDKRKLESQLNEYQDQQTKIDELSGKLTELQKQYDTLKEENSKLKSENESLKSQLAEQSSSSQSSEGGNSGGRLAVENDSDELVWLSETGSKYHSIPDCGRMNPNNAWQVLKSSAEAQGYDACKKCY